MKKYIYLLLFLLILNCNNERVLELPQIEKAEITEVLDVSPAYIFYDDTQPDSTLFNRKNLIGTTNWLVNVDKRLTLRQAIPHLQYLQEKRKKASMHKNENAKNYFTCNDTSIGNLGFVEFTEVSYNVKDRDFDLYISAVKSTIHFKVNFKSKEQIYIKQMSPTPKQWSIEFKDLKTFMANHSNNDSISMNCIYNKNLNFQDYISIKAELQNIESDKIIIDRKEFIY